MVNPFPATYPSYEQYLDMFRQRQTPQTQPVIQSQQSGVVNSNLVWVGSEKEAQDYMMAPNSVVFLRIPNSKDIYMKSTDNLGQPDFKRYSEVEIQPVTEDKTTNYMTVEAFNAWVNDNLTPTLEELKQRQARKTTRKVTKDESDADVQ